VRFPQENVYYSASYALTEKTLSNMKAKNTKNSLPSRISALYNKNNNFKTVNKNLMLSHEYTASQ
jgi:hypothetical protein